MNPHPIWNKKTTSKTIRMFALIFAASLVRTSVYLEKPHQTNISRLNENKQLGKIIEKTAWGSYSVSWLVFLSMNAKASESVNSTKNPYPIATKILDVSGLERKKSTLVSHRDSHMTQSIDQEIKNRLTHELERRNYSQDLHLSSVLYYLFPEKQRNWNTDWNVEGMREIKDRT